MTSSGGAVRLPPAAAEVVAETVAGLAPRLRKRLDAAVATYAAIPPSPGAGMVSVTCGEDAVVSLTPGPAGIVTDPDQASCTCLLAPSCLHRTAVLGACPVADPDLLPRPDDRSPAPGTVPADASPPASAGAGVTPGGEAAAGSSGAAPAAAVPAAAVPAAPVPAAPVPAASAPAAPVPAAPVPAASAPAAPVPAAPAQAATAQAGAAAALWSAAAAVLAAGVPAAGAVPQAELLRAAHGARLAGLHRAEAAALRVVRGLRGARAREDTHRLADLVAALRELLLTSGLLAAPDAGPALAGAARRAYQPGGTIRVRGVCREPVISATGYGGVVTHLLADDGRWHEVSDVRPGGPARAWAAGTATVALGSPSIDHAQLARGGLLVTGATVSPDGRLGAGRGVRATPVPGLSWDTGPLAALCTRPLAEAADAVLAMPPGADPGEVAAARELIGADVVIIGAEGDQVLACAVTGVTAAPGGPAAGGPAGAEAGDPAPVPGGPLIRLMSALGHPELAYLENLRQLASRPGLRVRLVGRLDPDRAATLLPLAAAPMPGTAATLRLPAQWHGHADLGYDRLAGAHFPPPDACPAPGPSGWPGARPALSGSFPAAAGPAAGSELWRYRQLVDIAVSGGRRAVSEFTHAQTRRERGFAALADSGFPAAAALAAELAAEAGRRDRDAFGRLTGADPDRYAWAWVAAAVHLAAIERELVRLSWHAAADPA